MEVLRKTQRGQMSKDKYKYGKDGTTGTRLGMRERIEKQVGKDSIHGKVKKKKVKMR